MINSNFGPILHRFWDTATYWLKIMFFIALSYSASLLPIFLLEFHGEVKRQETRVMGLLCGEDCMILTSAVFDWSTRATDRQTDGRWHIVRYSIHMLSRAKKYKLEHWAFLQWGENNSHEIEAISRKWPRYALSLRSTHLYLANMRGEFNV